MYEFQNAAVCPAARTSFQDSFEEISGVHETQELVKAARHVDQAMGILKRGYDLGSLAEHDYDELLSNVEEAEDILESLGILEDHSYLRDDIETRAAELLSIDGVDFTDEASEYENDVDWLYGDDD